MPFPLNIKTIPSVLAFDMFSSICLFMSSDFLILSQGYPGAVPAGGVGYPGGYPPGAGAMPPGSSGYPATGPGYPAGGSGYPAAGQGYPAGGVPPAAGYSAGGFAPPGGAQATPPHPNHLTPRHQVEVIQV